MLGNCLLDAEAIKALLEASKVWGVWIFVSLGGWGVLWVIRGVLMAKYGKRD